MDRFRKAIEKLKGKDKPSYGGLSEGDRLDIEKLNAIGRKIKEAQKKLDILI